MKNLLCLVISLALIGTVSAQGKFAGTLKPLVGKSFTDERNIAGLKGWVFREGTLLTPIDDPEMMAVDVLQKGTTYAVIFSYKEDTAKKEWAIADVIEIKNISKSWQIKTATCSQLGQPDIEIVAVAKVVNTEQIKTIKQAWRLNRDKRRVEKIVVKDVTCINEGLD